LDNYNPNKEQSIDEGMIAFKGRLSFKQYLPAKPTKFGIKVSFNFTPLIAPGIPLLLIRTTAVYSLS
jgi:hypothetical protein